MTGLKAQEEIIIIYILKLSNKLFFGKKSLALGLEKILEGPKIDQKSIINYFLRRY